MRPPDFPGNQRRGGVVYPCVPEGNSQQHGSEIGAAVRLGLSGMNPRHRRPRARGFEGVGQYWPYTTKPAGPSPKPSSSNISQSMRSNKSRGTWPEILLSKHLRKRLVGNDLPGRPDFVYRDAKVAVFVHGCFWHRCPTHGVKLPKTHIAFWQRKFERNVERDRLNREELEAMGWLVLVVWEHQIREDPGRCARRVKAEVERLRRAHAVGGR